LSTLDSAIEQDQLLRIVRDGSYVFSIGRPAWGEYCAAPAAAKSSEFADRQ